MKTNKELIIAILVMLISVQVLAQDTHNNVPFKSEINISCTSSTILFKEDFGGNNTADNFIKQSGISQVENYIYVILPRRSAILTKNSYTISKQGHIAFGYLMDDHSYPGDITKGYLLQLYTDSVSNQLYSTQIDNLCENTKLSFSAWLASVKKCSVACPDSSDVAFVLQKPDGTILATYSTGNIPNEDPDWKQYGLNYTIPSGVTSIIFKIVNNTKNPNPISFVLDDIEVRSCTPSVSVSISPINSVCSGENVTLTGTYTNNGYFPGPLVYKWLQSGTEDLTSQSTWIEVGSDSTLSLNAVKASAKGYYRLVVGNSGTISNLNCNAISDPVYLGVKTTCTANIVQANADNIVILKNNLVLIDSKTNDLYTSCEVKNIKLSVLQTTGNTANAYFNDNKLMVYTPVADFSGRDSVLYQLECSGQISSAWAKIRVLDATSVECSYVACPTAKVTLGINAKTGETYKWYSQEYGGTLLGSGSSLTSTKTTAPVDFVWLQINSRARVPVCIYLSNICGNTEESMCENGTVILKEDFGGNNQSDPSCKPSGISQVIGYEFGICGATVVGSYSIMKNSNNRHVWYLMDDHTMPNDLTRGYLMVVDATKSAGQLYQYQIDNLCAGTQFSFSAWLSSLQISDWNDKANLIFQLEKLDGTPITKYYTGNIPDLNPKWKQYGFNFTVPNDITSLVLKIINNGTGSAGNDFVIDDIEVRLCVPPVSVTFYPTNTVCVGDSVNLKAHFTNDAFTEPLAYKWFKKDATGSWNDLSSETDISFGSVQPSNEGYYRVAVSSTGSIDNINCRSLSDPVYIKVDSIKRKAITVSICLDRDYIFNGKTLKMAGVYIDTLVSVSGCDSIITLTLKTLPSVTNTLYATIKKGETYYFGDDAITSPGIYKHTLQNVLGCDSLVILNLGLKGYETVYIPEVFTPNGDGVNDHFNITDIDQYPKNHLVILNRWGNKLFEAEPYLNDWDGRANFGVIVGDGLLPVGTYFYILDLRDGSPVKKGFIYLNR